MKLTAKEIEVMALLWDSEAAMTATEIIKASKSQTWKECSIYIIMNSLMKKGAIVHSGLKSTVTNNARAFIAAISPEDYVLSNIKIITQSGKSGIYLDSDKLITGISELVLKLTKDAK